MQNITSELPHKNKKNCFIKKTFVKMRCSTIDFGHFGTHCRAFFLTWQKLGCFQSSKIIWDPLIEKNLHNLRRKLMKIDLRNERDEI